MRLTSALFSPIHIGGRRLKNRLVGLPVYTGYAHPGGRVSKLLIDHYTRLSRSGAAMIVVANAAVSENGIVSAHNLRIDRDDDIPGLARLAKTIQSNGSLACLQLNHAGRFAKTEKPLLPYALDPSNLSFHIASLRSFMNFFPLERRFGLTRRLMRMAGSWTRAMTAEEKERTIDAFGLAASRACEAGFDMIEIHGAGGYLLCQFLSSFTNRIRFDCALDFNQRTVFPLDVFRKIKSRVPDAFPVGFRLITREWVPEGIDLSEAISFAQLLEKEGIAYISASAATYHSMLSPAVRKKMTKPGYLKQDVAELTRHVRIPTIISGRIVTPGLAEKLVIEGVASLIGVGRTLRADPEWLTKAEKPKPTIKTCINCNYCLKRVILDQGFSCRRWPQHVQEKTDLEIKLLSRNYQGLLVAANTTDLQMLQAALPHLLPDPQKLKTVISPTFLILAAPEKGPVFNAKIEDFFKKTERMLGQAGHTDAQVQTIVRKTEMSYDSEVYRQAREGNHGLIFIPRNIEEPWRSKVAYKQRGKIVVFIGTNSRWTDILVPVDLSISTLLTLMYLQQTFMNRDGIRLHFVHVQSVPERSIEQRWRKIKKMIDCDEHFPLRLIDRPGGISENLLALIEEERFDMIVMGRRGVSRMKRWILGSVSAGLLRGVTDETLFLID